MGGWNNHWVGTMVQMSEWSRAAGVVRAEMSTSLGNTMLRQMCADSRGI
jgi:hypothetical protein